MSFWYISPYTVMRLKVLPEISEYCFYDIFLQVFSDSIFFILLFDNITCFLISLNTLFGKDISSL